MWTGVRSRTDDPASFHLQSVETDTLLCVCHPRGVWSRRADVITSHARQSGVSRGHGALRGPKIRAGGAYVRTYAQ